jgi:hypothetical protein
VSDLLALRHERAGLGERSASMTDAVACPASDFARDAALHAIAARADGVTREAYDAAVDAGEIALAHVLRGAIHALPGSEIATYLPLVGADPRERIAQMSRTAAVDRFEEVVEATRAALANGPLDKNGLHDAYRELLPAELLPWCATCERHHVHPSVWRSATLAAPARLDSQRRYVLADVAEPGDVAGRFQHAYPGASVAQFAEWAGITPSHARRLWVEPTAALPPAEPPRGVRLLPPGDPFLQKPNRELLAPDRALRKQLFRAVGSPGIVLRDGRISGTWRLRKGRVETDADVPREEIDRLESLY